MEVPLRAEIFSAIAEVGGMRERLWLTEDRLRSLEREFPDSYDRETTRIPFAIRALAQYINDEANLWLEPFGLNAGTYNYLVMLYAAKARRLTQNEIRKLVHTTHSTVTQMISTMERDGLVKRLPNADDRRSVIVTLTRKGAAKIRAALPAHHVALQARLRRLSKAQQQQLLELLHLVREGFDAEATGAVVI